MAKASRVRYAARLLVVYLALMVVVWFGWQVLQTSAPRSLDCNVVAPDELFCVQVAP